MFPPNYYNSSLDLYTEFHTTTPNCLLNIFTSLPNRQTNLSCPNLGSWYSPQTCFSCCLSYLSKCQLHSFSDFGQTPGVNLSTVFLSHPTSNLSAKLVRSNFKVYSEYYHFPPSHCHHPDSSLQSLSPGNTVVSSPLPLLFSIPKVGSSKILQATHPLYSFGFRRSIHSRLTIFETLLSARHC